MHSAKMRLPSSWDHKRIKEKVLEIIHFLEVSKNKYLLNNKMIKNK